MYISASPPLWANPLSLAICDSIHRQRCLRLCELSRPPLLPLFHTRTDPSLLPISQIRCSGIHRSMGTHISRGEALLHSRSKGGREGRDGEGELEPGPSSSPPSPSIYTHPLTHALFPHYSQICRSRYLDSRADGGSFAPLLLLRSLVELEPISPFPSLPFFHELTLSSFLSYKYRTCNSGGTSSPNSTGRSISSPVMSLLSSQSKFKSNVQSS